MTRAIPFTKAQIRRAIEAAREAGLRVRGIAPDGTLLLEEPDQDRERLGDKRDISAEKVIL
jgi:hypothetical protein